MKRRISLGKPGFALLLVLLLGGSFALGTLWVSGDWSSAGKLFGLFRKEPLRPTPAPQVRMAGEGPEIRIVEPEPRFVSHLPGKSKSSETVAAVSPPDAEAGAEVGLEAEIVYAVQVGAFRNPDDAEGLTQRLTNRGYSAYIVVAEVPSQGILHKVRIGRYPGRAAADNMAKTILQKEGLQSFVTYR